MRLGGAVRVGAEEKAAVVGRSLHLVVEEAGGGAIQDPIEAIAAQPTPADEEAAEPTGDEEPAEGEPTEQETETSTGSSRRRRRRRRGGSDDEGGQDDPPNTVTRVREPRARSASSEITSVKGSTRLEAKKQRRREGRETGRRRPSILTEAEFLARREWFFAPWNAEEVRDPKSGRRIPFHQASPELLSTDPNCWVLHPGERWHGFGEIPDGWCMLDPIKFGIVCPGMKDDGQLDERGIPADIVTAYLGRHGIVPSRTTDHMVLFLFSVGITKGKWGTLLNTLLDFKTDYDRNAALAEVLPSIANAGGDRYAGMGLRDLGDEIWAHMRKSRQGWWQAKAYATLPRPEMTPRRAFQKLMAGEVEKVAVTQMANRVVAVGVIPYPPGIPIVMPGENIGAADGPWITYLKALQEFGHRFPGFAKEVEGAEEHDGTYQIYCLTGT